MVPVLFTFYIQDVLKLKKKIIPAPKGYYLLSLYGTTPAPLNRTTTNDQSLFNFSKACCHWIQNILCSWLPPVQTKFNEPISSYLSFLWLWNLVPHNWEKLLESLVGGLMGGYTQFSFFFCCIGTSGVINGTVKKG